MGRIGASFAAVYVCGALMCSTALARSTAHPTGATYSSKAFTFSYPDGWAVIPPSMVQPLASPFTRIGSGIKLAGVGGVSHPLPGGHSAVVAVLVKLAFGKRLQDQIHKHPQVYFQGVVAGLKSSPGQKVVRQGQGNLGGLSASTVDTVSTNKNPFHLQYYVALGGDRKSSYIAIFVAVPATVWAQYRTTFASIARSAQFR